ncbi:hypothetical protein [Phenylobacterium sp.]|uniref:hypothetical protein n=1 Tax=Phenylobacterium sp. TaxID=1871053 RepID=UPI002FC5F629
MSNRRDAAMQYAVAFGGVLVTGVAPDLVPDVLKLPVVLFGLALVSISLFPSVRSFCHWVLKRKRGRMTLIFIGALLMVTGGYIAYQGAFAGARLASVLGIAGAGPKHGKPPPAPKGGVVGERTTDERGVTTGPTPKGFPTVREAALGQTNRSQFTRPLKAFISEGVDLKLTIQAADGELLKQKQDLVWVWQEKVGMWICENMGEYAVMKFADIAPVQPTLGIAKTKEAAASVIIMDLLMNNLQAIVERDTWDPEGAPVLPARGCRAVVGRATDRPYGSDPAASTE